MSDWLPRRSIECGVGAVERLRIGLPRRKVVRVSETLRAGFSLDVKCSYGRSLIYRCALGDEFFGLRRTLQGHVWPEEAFDEFTFLILSMGKRESSQE